MTLEELNHVVHSTLNRIVFLRNCEDRGIEPHGTLRDAVTDVTGGWDMLYGNVLRVFEDANRRYNAGVFDLDAFDKISYKIKGEKGVLRNIILNTYYPKALYKFDLIGVEILGTVYERFLGKTIEMVPSINPKTGKQDTRLIGDKKVLKFTAKTVEKPEVRKSGGVFYTPQYIVKYIVEETVGKLVAGKTVEEVSKISICDPACGSGAFLLGAYQFLLAWQIGRAHV